MARTLEVHRCQVGLKEQNDEKNQVTSVWPFLLTSPLNGEALLDKVAVAVWTEKAWADVGDVLQKSRCKERRRRMGGSIAELDTPVCTGGRNTFFWSWSPVQDDGETQKALET